ncbi:MAG: cyclic nucleotide-binding domain-containing protein [Gammaproteobacteria bacterium]|nr:cyclic nucleotide-binding domain-containing protein [Gammaproteobacteria bacterium]
MPAPVDIQFLRNFVPLGELTIENLQELAGKIKLEALDKDKPLFKRGQSASQSIYLLKGEVYLLAEDGGKSVVVGGTAQSRNPLDPAPTRTKTAIAKTPIQFFRVDNGYLDLLLSWDKTESLVVSGFDSSTDDDDDDWMGNMLKSEIFQRIPPASLQMLFIKMEAVPFKADEVVIRQGDEGDYYYYIRQGQCVVTHAGASGKEIKLADLNSGTGFGEDALISNNTRNATVTMSTDGVLMRLGKADFEELLKNPTLHQVEFSEAMRMVKEDDAVIIDVRHEKEFKQSNLKGSINIPLFMLRFKTQGLSKKHKYITLCDTGRRSSSAAFILNEKGYDAYFIDGGLKKVSETLRQKKQKSEG